MMIDAARPNFVRILSRTAIVVCNFNYYSNPSKRFWGAKIVIFRQIIIIFLTDTYLSDLIFIWMKQIRAFSKADL